MRLEARQGLQIHRQEGKIREVEVFAEELRAGRPMYPEESSLAKRLLLGVVGLAVLLFALSMLPYVHSIALVIALLGVAVVGVEGARWLATAAKPWLVRTKIRLFAGSAALAFAEASTMRKMAYVLVFLVGCGVSFSLGRYSQSDRYESKVACFTSSITGLAKYSYAA